MNTYCVQIAYAMLRNNENQPEQLYQKFLLISSSLLNVFLMKEILMLRKGCEL